MKKRFLRLICRIRVIAAVIAWMQLRAFFAEFSSPDSRPVLRQPADKGERPLSPMGGILATEAAFSMPVKFALEWRPVFLLRLTRLGAGAIRPADRFDCLFSTDPDRRRDLAYQMRNILRSTARTFGNTSDRSRGLYATAAETGDYKGS